jgi:hypothetical protein
MLKRALIMIALTWIVWGSGSCTKHGRQSQTGKGEAPEIIDSYAAEVIRSGETLRVYLKAKDNDGDMRNIIASLSQTGRGVTGTSSTPIEEKHSEEVGGYLALRTPRDRRLGRDRFTLRIFVDDSQGNRSETVEFPLRFANVPPAETPEKWKKIEDRSLGFIKITIKSSARRRSRGDRWF